MMKKVKYFSEYTKEKRGHVYNGKIYLICLQVAKPILKTATTSPPDCSL